MTRSLLYPFGHKPSTDTLTPLRQRPPFDISVVGFIYACMLLFMATAAITTEANLLYAVGGLMIGVLFVSYLICRIVINRLRITRELPEHAVVGRPATFIYHFHNDKRFWPSLSISLAEIDGVDGFTRQPQSYLLHAAARATASVPVEVIPKRRGLQTLDLHQLCTSFPFGFIKLAVMHNHHDTMLVLPAIATVDPRLLAMCLPAEKTGPTMRPRRGGVDEFYGLKEHRRGENPRWIYWRRSARTGVLVSKEMTQVAPPRLLLMVDTYLSSPTRAEHARVEKVIAMAASLASAALEQGLSVGLHIWMNGWNGLPPTRGKRQRRELMSMLARLPANFKQDAQSLLGSCQTAHQPGTTIVLLTGQNLELSLPDQLRGGVLVVSAEGPHADWFKFDSTVDFNSCIPLPEEMALTD
jgi:uncharacterized protein (DUF58 family)